MDKGDAILIAGPTAGGKSALALGLARRRGGIIINADSMAVYRDLRILTGRPTAADLAAAPHRLYGHIDGATPHSVGRWIEETEAVLREIWAEGGLPIVVGGTGLYFKALTQGLSDIPSVPAAIRARLRAEADGVPAAQLHARLAACDPLTAAKLRPTDPQRVLRALEIFETTGQPLATFQNRRSPPLLRPGRFAGLALVPEREHLRAAIDRRFDQMMAQGALDEVRALEARGLDPAVPVCRALGVPPLLACLAGETSLEAAIAAAKAETRAYAKRQVTFLRHQLPAFAWHTPGTAETFLHGVVSAARHS